MTWRTYLFIGLTMALLVIIGMQIGDPTQFTAEKPQKPQKAPVADFYSLPNQITERDENTKRSTHENHPDAISNERLISFKSESALEDFLANAGSNIKILRRSAYGNTLKVGFRSRSDLDGLTNDADVLLNFPVSPPVLENGLLAPGAEGFNGRMREWMGINGDNSQWGAGLSVAVIDTGIMDHTALEGVPEISLVDLANDEGIHPHGTTMAALWREGNGNIPAIAPAVDLTSIRVAGETGVSDIFTLAEAIFVAADEGVDLITISMGAPSTNSFLDEAITFAVDNGSVILASFGNNGQELALYPAAHQDVLGVGAIDFNNNHPGFSNFGEELAFVAPGVEILTAGPENSLSLSTGTSPAAQIGAAALAAFITETGQTDIQEAATIFTENLNELGLPDTDTVFGNGRPQMDVLLNYDTPGIFDAAIAGNLISTDESGSRLLQVVVDNPGTETLTNAELDVTVQGQSFNSPLPSIDAKESYQFELPIRIPASTEQVTISSTVSVASQLEDARPQDNAQRVVIPIGE